MTYTYANTTNKIRLGFDDRCILLIRLILETVDEKIDIQEAKVKFIKKYDLNLILHKINSSYEQDRIIEHFETWSNNYIILYLCERYDVMKYIIKYINILIS